MNITRYLEQFGSYRYRLRVEFTDQDTEYNHGTLVFIMFNPATIRKESDLTVGSRTRRRCVKFAKGEGYKAMTEVNLFAYRSSDKADLLKVIRNHGISAVGPENDRVIAETVEDADRAVFAWGKVADNRMFAERAAHVAESLKRSGKQLYCLGKNGDGSPKQPVRGTYSVQTWP